MVHPKIIVKRIFNRLKYVFIWKELFTWPYESCKRCGHCFKQQWSVADEVWKKVMEVSDSGGGSLCLDCFIEVAKRKRVPVKGSDFDVVKFFIPSESDIR